MTAFSLNVFVKLSKQVTLCPQCSLHKVHVACSIVGVAKLDHMVKLR